MPRKFPPRQRSLRLCWEIFLTKIDGPDADQLEVSVFSRGYGEAICVHMGSGRWVAIDSLRDADGLPATLRYLRDIGVDPSGSVDAVLITHWHDDHIQGAASLVETCASARIAVPGVLLRDEFQGFLKNAQTVETEKFSSGVDELIAIFEHLRSSGKKARFCFSERPILESISFNYRIEALSPSDQDIDAMLHALGEWARESSGLSCRLSSPRRNDVSVAAAVEARDSLILLGADLEVTRSGAGWEEVHANAWRARGKADFFKIAHHGSHTGDYSPVWADMLVENVTAVLTPWSRGSKLPTALDRDRILSSTSNAHAAAKVRLPKAAKRVASVERSLREGNIQVHRQSDVTGHIRFRKRPKGDWEVEYLAGDSCHLRNVLA